jgi:hypothetical protein
MPNDSVRVAAYVRQYMALLVTAGELAEEDHEAFEAVLKQWHEGFRLPWMEDSVDAFRLLFEKNQP